MARKTTCNRYPLRRIREVLLAADDLYGRDKLLLECGHEAWGRGIYRIRCLKCWRQAEAARAATR